MKKALIVIDVQKGFINKSTHKTLLKIRDYIRQNHGRYDLLVFTKYLNHEGSNFVKNLKWRGFMNEKENDLADEIKEFAGAKNLFPKDTYGSFVDNKVFNYLRKNKIRQVEICGFDTENCVLTFARDAFDRGMSVVVLKDLSASHSNPKLHRAALEIIKDNIGALK